MPVEPGRRWLTVLLTVAACAMPAAFAATIEESGAAVVGPAGLQHARQAAIQDALQKISLRAGARIEVASGGRQRELSIESSRVQGTAAPAERYNVVREWRSGDVLNVIVAVDIDPAMAAVAQQAANYKRKIVATPFRLRTAQQLDDVNDVQRAVPRELLRQLSDSGRFMVKESNAFIAPGASGPDPDQDGVRRIARMYDSQFVLAGDIIDGGASEVTDWMGLRTRTVRRFELDLYLYDGLSGALVARHRFQESAAGAVTVGRDKPLGTNAFAATPYGNAVTKVMRAMVEAVSADLTALPFMSRVIGVDKETIRIAAGSTSGVGPGDTLAVYHVERTQAGWNTAQSSYGQVETALGTATVEQVQPEFAVCRLSPAAAQTRIEEGDVVRFDVGLLPRAAAATH